MQAPRKSYRGVEKHLSDLRTAFCRDLLIEHLEYDVSSVSS